MHKKIGLIGLTATLGLTALFFPSPAQAGTVGGEYTLTDACGNPTLPNAGNNVSGFVNTMQVFGHTRRFVYGNSAYWPDDLIDCSVSGGKDCYYGDTVNYLYVSSHGGSDATRFRITTGVTHTIDGQSTCRAWTSNPSTGTQWWKMGDGSVRVLLLYTCHGLELSDLPHWDPVAQGLHVITGGSGNMYDSGSAGSNVAFWGNLGLTIKSAWFNNVSADTKVVMAYGVNQADAINRRDNERFSWSTSRLGTKTWRAWSWVN
ncbi:MAG TPA: DUF6345 domain-containing protein [Armatimonadota bacterium]|jgi:hypothetical protein